jgi:hypothetical protein
VQLHRLQLFIKMNTIIKLTASPINVENPLGLTVRYDNSLLFDTDKFLMPETIVIESGNDEGSHCLTITLKNKTPEHTKINNQGEIISDSLISLTDIYINDVDISQLFFRKSVYYHSFNDEKQPLAQHQFYELMGCNGYVEFKFSTPLYAWLFENL